jgi:GTP-binding protein
MKIISAEFVTSAASPTQYPRQRLPEVAFAGRSNVGKSSLINTLVHRKNLVKTSGTPGKTRTLNFFVVNGRFSFVDFPGYGYARVPREMQASWRPMVEAYMKHQDMLRAVVHIIDFRHTPSELDWQLRAWLLNKQVTVLTVATKTDKVKRNQRAAHEREIRRALALPDDEPLLLFSSHNHEGRLRLWQRLMPWLAPLGHT